MKNHDSLVQATSPSPFQKIRSASRASTNQLVFDLISPFIIERKCVLDFGAGLGHMCQRLGELARERGLSPADIVHACEIDTLQFEYGPVSCKSISDDCEIPFPHNFLNAIYSIEVLEHTRRPYDFFNEAYRALKPGGILVVTIPNIAHMLSRLKFFLTGFSQMFGPPSKQMKNAGRICGHIMPLSYPYLHYGATLAGFTQIRLMADRIKRSSRFLFLLFSPLLLWGTHCYLRELKQYDLEVRDENQKIVQAANTLPLIASRSCIVVAEKPA
jgi:SAM-dependent methyltransferase